MKKLGPITISDIMAATGLSRATIDRVLNKRPGVHPRTQAHVPRVLSQLENGRSPSIQTNLGLTTRFRFGLVVQAGQAFTRSLLNEIQRLAEAGPTDATFDGFTSRSDDETVDLIQTVGQDRDGIAAVAKNVEPIKSAVQELRGAGKPVVALVSDPGSSFSFRVRRR